MEKSGKKSFVLGAFVLAAAGLVCKIIGAVFRIPLYNMLGDGMQYYEAVFPYYSTLITISTAGLPTAISRMVAERVSLGDYQGAKNVFRKAQLLLFIFGLLTAGLMYAGADYLARSTVGIGAAMSFRMMAPSLLIVAMICSYRGYLQGMQLMNATAVTQLVEQICKLTIGLYLAFRWVGMGPEYGAMGAIAGVTGSEIIALIVVILFYLRRRTELLPYQDPAIPVRQTGIGKELMSIAIPVTIGGSIVSLTGIADSLLIKNTMMEIGFTEAEASMRYVCLRSNVATIVNLPGALTVALAMSLVPAISAFRTRQNMNGIHQATCMGMKLAMLLGMPCTVGLFVLAGPSVDLLYNIDTVRLNICEGLMRTEAFSVIFVAIVQTLTGILQGVGKQSVPVVNLTIGGVVKVLIMMTLMRNPAIEIQGAAISNVACYLVAGLLDFIYLVWYTKVKLPVMDTFVKPTAASLIMGVAVYFAYQFLAARMAGVVATLLSILVAIVIYLALILTCRMFTEEDLAFVPPLKRFSRLLSRKKA